MPTLQISKREILWLDVDYLYYCDLEMYGEGFSVNFECLT